LSEAFIQKLAIQKLKRLYPKLLVSVSWNGQDLGSNSYAKDTKRKQEHFLKGIPDITIYLPKGKSIHIEFKTPHTRNNQSKDQKKIETWLNELDHQYEIVTSTEELLTIISQVVGDPKSDNSNKGTK